LAAIWDVLVEVYDLKESETDVGLIKLESCLTEKTKTTHLLFAYITLCYIPLIVIGNLVILGSTYTYKKLHNTRNTLLCSVAVSDLIMGFFTIPMYATAYLEPERIRDSGKHICLLWFFSIQIAAGPSLSSLLLISADRFIAVFMPIQYDTIMSKRNCKVFIAIVWIYNISVGVLPFLGVNTYDYEEDDACKRCNYYRTLPWAYVVVASFGHIGVNIAVSFILNVIVFYKLWRMQSKVLKEIQDSAESSGTPAPWSLEKVKQLMETFHTIKVSFCLCSL